MTFALTHCRHSASPGIHLVSLELGTEYTEREEYIYDFARNVILGLRVLITTLCGKLGKC